jgi:hypothetical protein
MASTYEYDSDQIAVTLGGILIGGSADGSFLKIEMETDDFSDVAGTDGTVVRSKTLDGRATVTISLLQSSVTNNALSALRAISLATANGAGVVPFLMKDLNGTTLCGAAHAWIQKAPDQEFDRGAKSRDWVIRCADMRLFIGGNPSL